ncbi:MAG: hypothetical protein L6R37_006563 [Teloschistes peruensis]|nr:MAG: hypothetical protein L6R37_006563 [Teloschistes peruensis]
MSSAFPPSSLRPILQEVARLLVSRNETISVAETAAGGIISASLLSVPGASKFYRGGLTLYTLESRIQFAGWTEETRNNYSGPNKEVVSGLARHGQERVAKAGSEHRKVFADRCEIATQDAVVAEEQTTGMGGDREQNMVEFARLGLELLRKTIVRNADGLEEGKN